MKKSDLPKIKEISNIIYENYGIFITADKFFRFEPKLEKLIYNEKYSGFEELYERILIQDKDCMNTLISYITTGHTFFFRESDHFKNLITFTQKKPQKNYSIWCAACSTGEEPYSIAMSLINENIHNFHIVASDINKKVLDHFNRGIYHENRFTQMTPVCKLRYFTQRSNGFYEIDHSLRSHISIKNINLMEKVSFQQNFDFIFCRNVLIYFNEASRRQAIKNLVSNLKIGGILFIGHAEALLWQPENLEKIGSSIYYRTN